MKSWSYPRLGRVHKLKPGRKLCTCCERPAVSGIDIEIDWFRGNDDTFKVCEEHLKVARDGQFEQLYADAVNTNAARRRA